MTMAHLNYKTICLTAGLTTLLVAGPVQTANAREQTSVEFFYGVRDDDSRWRRDRDDYRRNYPNRNYRGPRYNSPSYYRRGYNYPNYYRRNYYRRHDDTDRFFVTATGVFFGILIGSEIIRYMNDVDQMRAREATYMAHTAPIGTHITWNNPQSYNSGSVTATRDGYSESGKYCREYYQTVSVGGRTQDAYGVACMQPDGAWRIVQ